ncbi:hypothetical protein P691DRAFT_576002 [Macrolepiota fuliginosa MF-IS2]|uniref:Uncharacterized protein n=1 Tax=Macrolepiota fuliginosa MF-IS2 TaxID=1400762 RepID=A0A9P6C2P5_9AGAR|nr:hypothetical protein P691DRAFT_576002 [Macrolepiota fuliginosa MF-IS2]
MRLSSSVRSRFDWMMRSRLSCKTDPWCAIVPTNYAPGPVPFPPEMPPLFLKQAFSPHPTTNEGDPHFPVILGTVSVHWREETYSTPSLWAHLMTIMKDSQYACHDTFVFLQLYFEISANQSISSPFLLLNSDETTKVELPDCKAPPQCS